MCPPTKKCPKKPYSLDSNFDELLEAAIQTGDVVRDYELGHEKFQPRCPQPNKYGRNQLTAIPHPLWCNRFYVCNKKGNAIEKMCKTGTIWNEETESCQFSQETPPHCVMATWGLNEV
jgi:Chitin binding Peritrophin-A domain